MALILLLPDSSVVQAVAISYSWHGMAGVECYGGHRHGRYRHSDNELPIAIEYDLVTAVKSLGEMGDGIFLLAQDGSNQFLERDATGKWFSEVKFNRESCERL